MFCSDGTAQEQLLPIILEASNSEIHNSLSSVWHTTFGLQRFEQTLQIVLAKT
jgi:hypothetical protein